MQKFLFEKDKDRTKKRTTRCTVPYVLPGKESDNEIKRRTGFTNEYHLIAFMILVYNSDLELLQKSEYTNIT